jgi:hypothetical protein
MNWEALSASGEVAGALLVIVSVVYLARQIQQNTAASRAQVLSTFSIAISQQYDKWGSDARISELMHKVIYEGVHRSDLEDADRTSISTLFLSRVYLYDATYRSYREGILREPEFTAIMTSRLWGFPFLIDSWPVYRMELSQDFVEYIEEKFDSLKSAGTN